MEELLLAEIKRRNVDIEFEDGIEKTIKWLKTLCLCTNESEEKVVKDFIQYYIDNYKD